MNYIRHLNNLLSEFAHDERVTPFHLSLYMALFQIWNYNHFNNPLSVSREETMRLAKIGSANTYIKCLRELHDWKYVIYQPSHNLMVGSKIHLYSFDNTNELMTENLTSSLYKTDNTNSNTTDNTSVTPVRHYININETNKNNKNKSKENEGTSKVNKDQEEKKSSNFRKSEKQEKVKSEEHLFSESAYQNKEIFKQAFANTDYAGANLDYYHEVIGNWSTSKGAKKKDWLATAKNWILRDFKEGKLATKSTPEHGKSNAQTVNPYTELGNAVDEWFERKFNK